MARIERGLWKVRARPVLYDNSYELIVGREGLHEETELFVMASAGKHEHGHFIGDEQIMHVDKGFLQAFIDCAWENGLRPTGYQNIHEAMKATDAHLQDMRAVAFGKLNIEPPK